MKSSVFIAYGFLTDKTHFPFPVSRRLESVGMRWDGENVININMNEWGTCVTEFSSRYAPRLVNIEVVSSILISTKLRVIRRPPPRRPITARVKTADFGVP